MKGMVFSLDIIIGISILIIILLSSNYLFSVPEIHEEIEYEQMNLVSNDFLNSMAEIKVFEAANQSKTIKNLITNRNLTEDELELSVLDLVLTYWGIYKDENDLLKKELAENITKDIINSIPDLDNINFSLFIGNDSIAGSCSNTSESLSVSSLIENTYGSGPKYGYIARAYLSGIKTNKSRYLYFGGFVGQGDLNFNLNIPETAGTIISAYIEVYSGSNFSLYINGNFSGNFSVDNTTGNFSANIKSADINLSNFIKGNNTIEIKFTSTNITNQYLGGGFLKVNYNSTELYEEKESGKMKYYFPGITGLINFYDGFYVDGDLNNMSAYIHYKNNISGGIVYLTIANSTIFRSNETGDINITFDNSNLSYYFNNSGLNYTGLSMKTIPLKFGIENIIPSNGEGYGDAVLITDVSGSMITCDVDSNCTAGICDTSDPCHRKRINVAKDADKNFVDGMLNITGNRVGLVAFSSGIYNTHKLSTDNDSLKSQITGYPASGGTCICCGINSAKSIATESFFKQLIDKNSNWEYNTNYPAAEPPEINTSNWKDINYNDTNWSSGNAILGFCNITWNYRQAINISNTAGNLTDYQVKIELNSSNTGSNWNWSNEGSDIRFTNSTNDELDFWIESWNSTANTSAIWIKIPFLENNTNTTVYLYYGNPSANSASDGEATFEFFDDFEGSSLNSSKWTDIQGSYTISNSAFHGNGGNSIEWVRTTSYQTPGSIIVEFSMKPDFASGDWDAGVGIGSAGQGTASGFLDDRNADQTICLVDTIWWSGYSDSNVARSDFNTYHTYKVVIDTAANRKYMYDLTDGRSHNRAGTKTGYIWLITDSDSSGRDTSYDWICVRKYSSAEPAVSNIGSEETTSKKFGSDIDTDIENNGGNYFFRKQFTISNLNRINKIYLYVLSDDNAEVYINGYLIDNDTVEHTAKYWNRGETIESFFEDGFESGINNSIWSKGGSSSPYWIIYNNPVFEGTNSSGNNDISNNQNSWIEMNTNLTAPANLDFYWKVSSETNYDFLRFSIDGSEKDSISGETDWQEKTYTLSPGNHILRWSYTKDGSVSTGSDTGWIDKIIINKTVKIEVNKSYLNNGKNIVAVKLKNNDDEVSKFDLKLEAEISRKKAMLVMSDGSANRLCAEQGTGDAEEDAIWAACEARDNYDITTYAVAFGSNADEDTLKQIACWNCSACDPGINPSTAPASCWLSGENYTNCSRYYHSNNEEELKKIYKKIADDIVNMSFEKQVLYSEGNISLNNSIYGDSYLEFNYNETKTTFNYGEFYLNFEKNCINASCTLEKNNETKVLEAKVTSYSADYWTNQVILTNSTSENISVYDLSEYGLYENLGDPFIINIPTAKISNGVNNIRVYLGISSADEIIGSNDSKLIYSLKVPGSVNYGDIFNTSYNAEEDAKQRLKDKIYNLTGQNISIFADTDTNIIRGVRTVSDANLVKLVMEKE